MNIDRAIERLASGAEDDPDAEWKAAIELGAAKTGGQRVRAAAALTAALRSGRAHALIRAHAVESLGKLGLPRSAEVLTEALTDPYRLVRSYAAGATEGRSGRAPPPVAHA